MGGFVWDFATRIKEEKEVENSNAQPHSDEGHAKRRIGGTNIQIAAMRVVVFIHITSSSQTYLRMAATKVTIPRTKQISPGRSIVRIVSV